MPSSDSRRDVPARRRGSRTQWVPVADLSPMAQALLSEDLGGRDVVPGHVADRVTERAEQWVAHGFTVETVRPWQDLAPAAAAFLAERGVDPRVLDLPVEAFPGAKPVPLRVAIGAERIPVERAYELLVLTGEHQPKLPTPPAKSAASVRPIAPVLFSHAKPDEGKP
ncbi:hypothetical protein [Phytohabitans rumicis]